LVKKRRENKTKKTKSHQTETQDNRIKSVYQAEGIEKTHREGGEKPQEREGKDHGPITKKDVVAA